MFRYSRSIVLQQLIQYQCSIVEKLLLYYSKILTLSICYHYVILLTLICFTKLEVVWVFPDIQRIQCLHFTFILPVDPGGTSKWLRIVAILYTGVNVQLKLMFNSWSVLHIVNWQSDKTCYLLYIYLHFIWNTTVFMGVW